MYRRIYIIIAVGTALLLAGCSVSSLPFMMMGKKISQLPLPVAENGYYNLSTQVIDSAEGYQSLLNAIEQQNGWKHKVAFGIKLGEIHFNFEKENLLIYRQNSTSHKVLLESKVLSTDHNTTVVQISEKLSDQSQSLAQALFFRVSKSVARIVFKSKNGESILSNKSQGSITATTSVKKDRLNIPQKCIAWFDGCNHCIRSATGKPLCTKRYCKKKGQFRCMKWK